MMMSFHPHRGKHVSLSSRISVWLSEPGLLSSPPYLSVLGLLPLIGLKAGQRKEAQPEGLIRPCCCRLPTWGLRSLLLTGPTEMLQLPPGE